MAVQRTGARRPRPGGEAQRQQEPSGAPPSRIGVEEGGGSGSPSSSVPRGRGAKPALLMATAAAAAALLLLAATPGGHAFAPPLGGQHQHQHQHQQRRRQRPHATMTPDMLRSMPSPSQPPGGSSPTPPGSSATSPSASAASLAPPPTARRRSQPSVGLPPVEPAGAVHHARQHHQQEQQHQQQHQQHEPQEARGPLMSGPVVQVLAEELPGISLEAARDRAPRLFQLEDAGALRRRLQALRAALPGGVNVTHAVLEVPRLATYYGKDAAAMERAVGPRFRALCEATGTAADAAEIVNRWPRVLLRDFETRVWPHLEALGELLPGSDATYLLRKHPAVLGKSVAAHLRPRIEEHLPALFPADAGLVDPAAPAAMTAAEALTPAEAPAEAAAEVEESGSAQGRGEGVGLGALAVSYPELLTAPLAQLRARVEALTALVPPELLLPTLSRHSRAWTADLAEEVGPQVALLRARLGEATASAVLLNLPSAMYHAPSALEKRLDVLEALLGPPAHAVLALNPMILAVDASAHVAPKVRYLRALFDPEVVDDASFHGMLATEAGAKCLTAAFGRLGRLSYLLQVQPGLDLAAGLKLCVTSSEELRRRYPGYENFLEDRIEPRFPNYTWEQLCALPFAMREQAHGEILHRLYSLPADGEDAEGAGWGQDGDVGGGFFEAFDPLALLDDEEEAPAEEQG